MLRAAQDANFDFDGLAEPVKAPVRAAQPATQNDVTGFPCLSDLSRVKTDQGEMMLADVRVGDRVLTRDNGYQSVGWIVRCNNIQHNTMYCVRAGAFGPGLPMRDLVASGDQRVLTKTGNLRALGGSKEALIALSDLCHMDGIEVISEAQVSTRCHVLMACHELILVNDIWTETYCPQGKSLKYLSQFQQDYLTSMYPKLKTAQAARAFPQARAQMKVRVSLSGAIQI